MSQDSPHDKKSSSSDPRPAPAAEEKLERIIERVPPEQYPTLLRETLIGIIREGASPKIDPETFKIAAATVEKDNENRFQYLMKKLDVDAKTKNDDCEFEKEKFRSVTRLLWPILSAAIVLVLGCITSGIYLAATGRETLGFSILSATVAALFSYLGGLGTPRFWKN
jgi:hypothetical protein